MALKLALSGSKNFAITFVPISHDVILLFSYKQYSVSTEVRSRIACSVKCSQYDIVAGFRYKNVQDESICDLLVRSCRETPSNGEEMIKKV
jgi:hypothetical protein